MKEFGEKVERNQPKSKLTEFFRNVRNSLKFRSQWFEMYEELNQTQNIKVVSLFVLYKFAFGQISSVIHILSEKSA